MVDFAKLSSLPGYALPSKDHVHQEGAIEVWRKHHTTGIVTKREGKYQIYDYASSQGAWIVFRLVEGGPTGYESFTLVDEEGPHISTINSVLSSPYWSACAGTPERWDECRVTKAELRRVLIPWIERASLVDKCHKCDQEGMLAEDPFLLKSDRMEFNFWCCDCHSQRAKEQLVQQTA